MQLPSDIRDFTGRELHVEQLCDLLVPGESPGAVPVALVAGAGGLGKTTLAIHAAHQMQAEYPDGQLYVDLLGSSSRPLSPAEVLARLLRDLGVPGAQIPVDEDERAAMYRTRLNGRRMLVLLDNARDASQVRPLLPGSGTSAVIVTSRSRLPTWSAVASSIWTCSTIMRRSRCSAGSWGRCERPPSRTPPLSCSSRVPGFRWPSHLCRPAGGPQHMDHPFPGGPALPTNTVGSMS